MKLTTVVHTSVLDEIGNTPMHEVSKIDTGKCRLLLKLENQNPGGSIKDRIGKVMIETAEADGSLKPGATIIEATAGNTGLGLALSAAQKGYKLVIIVPDKMAQEKVFHLRAMGAEVLRQGHYVRDQLAHELAIMKDAGGVRPHSGQRGDARRIAQWSRAMGVGKKNAAPC